MFNIFFGDAEFIFGKQIQVIGHKIHLNKPKNTKRVAIKREGKMNASNKDKDCRRGKHYGDVQGQTIFREH